jgi:hypothetical protein
MTFIFQKISLISYGIIVFSTAVCLLSPILSWKIGLLALGCAPIFGFFYGAFEELANALKSPPAH